MHNLRGLELDVKVRGLQCCREVEEEVEEVVEEEVVVVEEEKTPVVDCTSVQSTSYRSCEATA